MEENAYTVEKTPVSGGGSMEVSGSGGGSGDVNDVTNVNGSVPSVVMKRKRGRPKKLPVEAQSTMFMSSAPPMGFPSPNSIHQPVKRGRGRPRGSSSKARSGVSPPPGFGGGGGIFGYAEEIKPHVLQIYPGEDVHGRILSFAQNGNRAITVMSCTGPVAQVSICSPGSAGGMIYEGLCEILNLNGTFTYGGPEGSYHRRGTLTACLAKANGEVFGGCVSGPIIAAGPIQLILGSFEQGRRPSPTNIQFRSYHPAPHQTNPTPPAAVQVPVSKANESFQQAQDALLLLPSLISDPLCTTNAPVASNDQAVFAPFLQMPQPALNQPRSDIEAQVADSSFADENLVANNDAL